MAELPIEITPLGGVGEFGKNCLVVRAGEEAIVLDAGISFPDESLPGVDRVAPDFSVLRGEKLAGIFLTHGHEDHIGALPQLLEEGDAPVFATPFTKALAARRLAEAGVRASLEEVEFHRAAAAGAFSVTFLPVSHSVPQSAALAIEVGGRRIFHTGDFKLDSDGLPNETTDLEAFARAGRGCDLLLLDSTNAERGGACPSEALAREGLAGEIGRAAGRVVLTTFSSHVARISGAVEAAKRSGRQVGFLGKSVREVAQVAERFGYLSIPSGLRLDRESLSGAAPARLLLVCAGSQGEPFSALHRLALGLHPDLKLSPGDRAVFSARAIPGREQAIARVMDHLLRRGVSLRRDVPDLPAIHVSGHAYRDDLKRTVAALAPRSVMPVHGQRRALAECADAAAAAGVPRGRIHLCDNGDSLFLEEGDRVRFAPSAREARAVFLDSALGSEIEGEALRERRLLGAEGLVVVLAAMSAAGPMKIEVVSRGLAADAAEIASEVGRETAAALKRGSPEERLDPEWARSTISLAVKRLCRRRYGARPMIVPIVAEG
jgi:ribonuclease J